ncbi:phosphohydrolase, partial [Turicibacter sanguinis]|nr:phosphohydrolase [Turicibacter sanguinis]
MNNFTFKDIMLVFQKCFNYIDTRLDRHCEQVAFLYWKTLQHTGKYTEEELVNLTLIALFHDIGTYKTKDFSEFLYNTSPNPHLHSICGSLFIKYFSPLSHLSDIILH